MSTRKEVLEHLKNALQSIVQQHAPSATANIEAAMSDNSIVNGRLTSAKHAVGQYLWSAAKYDLEMAIAELQHR